MRLKTAAWWRRLPRWLAVPWTSGALLAALVAATGVPAFLLVVAAGWQSAAEDAIAAQVADDADLERSGVDIRIEARFEAEPIDRADELLRAGLEDLPATTDPDFTLYTLPGNAASVDADRVIGTPLRIAAQDGLLDQIEVIASSDQPREGLWISEWYAERFGLTIGDELRVEAGFVGDVAFNDEVPGLGRIEVWTVTAVYETIWAEDAPTPAGPWSTLPDEVLPRFLRPLQAPSAALAFADFDVLADSGLTGFARWRNESTGLPPTLAGLEAHRDEYRAVETTLVAAGPIGDALRSAAAGAGRNPSFDTELYATVARAVDASALIDAPLNATLALGLVLATAVVAAAGLFIVERRRAEFRLLAGEGDGCIKLGGRVALQSLLPALVGLGSAVAGGLVVARIFGPAPTWSTESTPLVGAAIATLAAVTGIGAVAGWTGARSLRSSERDRRGVAMSVALAVATAATGWLWIQTTDQRTDRVDLASISLPVAAFAAAGLAALVLIDVVLRRAPTPSVTDHPTLLLGIRRVQAGAVPLRLAALAIGLGFGLVVTSVSLVRTFDRSVDAKLATEVGAETRWSLAATEDTALLDLPARTAMLLHQDTRTTPGGQPTRVVAVDPETLGDPVAWPAAFGLNPELVSDLLERGDRGFVPALAIDGEPTPDEGAFGALQPFPYRVVARTTALPLAGEFGATILVSADAVDELGEQFHTELTRAEEASVRREASELAAAAEAAGETFDIDGYVESQPTVPFTTATDRFRVDLVSDLSTAQLRGAFPLLEPREEISAATRRTDPDLVGVRLGFEFVRVVGGTALALAAAALLLQVAARRRTSALSSVMARAVGLPTRTIVAATGLEIFIGVAATVGATALVAPPVVGRLAERFDPLPRIPPQLDADLALGAIIGVAIAVMCATAGTAALIERRDLRRSPAEVVRDAG